jgi:alkanesulfonate monooxygenase SsuD/methylene tetrahydromethanopterin reductase-like flavin-dependent oxidoreductase (luciferase family)
VDAPALDAWSTAAALAAVTHSLELMVAVRPTFDHPARLANTKLEQQLSIRDDSVSNRGLHTGLVGTPAQVAERVEALSRAGVDLLLLLQCSPQLEEMERFTAQVMPLVGVGRRHAA